MSATAWTRRHRSLSALGFTLTPRGHHTLGSMNHLMMFGTDYLELLGFGTGGATRPELAPFPVGLNGLVFKTADADAVHAHAAGAGLPILPVQIILAAGRSRRRSGSDARFRTTRLDPGKIAMGRVYFCEHLTPELVWRPEWQTHPNGAQSIARVVVATGEPRRTASLFAALFGHGKRRRSGRKMRDRRRRGAGRAGPSGQPSPPSSATLPPTRPAVPNTSRRSS